MASPEPQAVDMRHTKLKPEEAALIAGEIVKPSWASRNEGIHERVSFEDTLWGFEMAGGAFYKTPLRIAYVKPGSRAEQACIRMGDTVLRIQGIDTSTLTLQEAHQLVHEAGINLKIAVTSPDDDHDAHYEYQDPLMQQGGLTAEQLKALERERIQKAIAKAIRCRDLEWPWVRRKFIIYRESNCFMVPSKYENKHRDQFPELPAQKIAYFFPMEKQEKVQPVSTKKTNKIPEVKEPEVKKLEPNGDENLEEEEEYVSEEEENLEDNQNEEEESNERLREENIPEETVQEDVQKDTLDDITENENELGEQNEDEAVDTIRKDSEGSSIELDNNNNHVSKNKNSEIADSENIESIETIKNNSENVDNQGVDEIINELAGNDNELDANDVKSDDEVIDSVLNGDGDTQNER